MMKPSETQVRENARGSLEFGKGTFNDCGQAASEEGQVSPKPGSLKGGGVELGAPATVAAKPPSSRLSHCFSESRIALSVKHSDRPAQPLRRGHVIATNAGGGARHFRPVASSPIAMAWRIRCFVRLDWQLLLAAPPSHTMTPRLLNTCANDAIIDYPFELQKGAATSQPRYGPDRLTWLMQYVEPQEPPTNKRPSISSILIMAAMPIGRDRSARSCCDEGEDCAADRLVKLWSND